MVGTVSKRAAVAVGTAALIAAILSGALTSVSVLLLSVALGLAVGTALIVLQPRLIYRMVGATLGGLPFASLPAAGPAVLVLAVATAGTLLTRPIRDRPLHPVEWATVLLVAVSSASVVHTATSAVHLTEFAKWTVASGFLVVLLRLDDADSRLVQRSFAVGAAVGGGVSLALLAFDRAGTALRFLAPIGYGIPDNTGSTLRVAEVAGTTVTRLAGTYVHPNYAGIFLLVGLALALARTAGTLRIVTSLVIAVALIATLSRAAVGTVVVAGLLFLLFQKLDGRVRIGVIGASLCAVLAVARVPTVTARLAGSFGASDAGSSDRARALADFVPSMEGRWWFGRGWGAKELLDEIAGFQANYVANAPLLAVYRGGVLVGIVFTALLVVGSVAAYRRLRTPLWTNGIIGASFLAFVLVAMQLDFPVVTSPPVTMAFGVLLAAVVSAPAVADEPERHPQPVTTGGAS